MLRMNQSGFVALEIVVIIIAITVIGGAGYAVWHAKNTKNPTSSTTGLNTKTFDSEGLKFSYVYPANYEVLNRQDGSIDLYSPNFDEDTSGAPKILAGENIQIDGITTDSISQDGDRVRVTIDNYFAVNFSGDSHPKEVSNIVIGTTNGIKTLRYDHFDTRTTVFFVSDGKRIEVTLRHPSSGAVTDYDSVYNQIVNSIKL